MGMEVELILVAVLIIVFIASFCGLLQKIRKTYEHDRELTGATTVSTPRQSFTEIYINPTFTPDIENAENQTNNSSGVFPGAPPPYTETYCEPPPTYDDIIKDGSCRITISPSESNN